MGKKSTNNSTSSSGTGLFGTLRNSFRRRSSSSFSGKLNSSGSSAVSPKREPTSEAFPIVNQSQNGKVQKESNYSGSIKKNGVNNTDRVPENPLEINYRNSDVTAALKTTKLASNQTPETDCKESNLSEIKTEQPGESGKKEQTPLTGEAEVYSALPETAANNTDLKKMKTEDVSTDAEMFRFLSSGIYSNLALLSAMSRQASVNGNQPLTGEVDRPSSLPLSQQAQISTSEPLYSSVASTYDVVSFTSQNSIYEHIPPAQQPGSIASNTPPASPLSSADQSSTCPMSSSSLSIKSFSSSSESSQSSLKPSNPMMLVIKQHLQSKYPQYSIINQNDLQVLSPSFFIETKTNFK